MKYLFRYFLFLVIFPSHSFSQIITDSTIFNKSSFRLSNNHHNVVFKKIDSISYVKAVIQNIYTTFDTAYIKKRNGILIIPTREYIDTFKDDSIRSGHYCVFDYKGFLTKIKEHIVVARLNEANKTLFISENGQIDSTYLWVAIPSLSNEKIASCGGNLIDSNYYCIGVYQFDSLQDKYLNYWELKFPFTIFCGFKWLNDNDFIAMAYYEDYYNGYKRKSYYRISFK
jgi:hypothetical protein